MKWPVLNTGYSYGGVTLRVRVWIEIGGQTAGERAKSVTLRVRVWIEIDFVNA